MIQRFFERAKELYDVDLSDTTITYANLGKTSAGQAIMEDNKLSLRFNTQVSKERLESEVIPHEVAHLICFLKPELGEGHNSGWKAICLALGGVGTRTIKGLNLKPARITRNFLYRSHSGHDAVLTSIRHNKLQNGKVFEYILNKKYSIRAEHYLQELD